MTTIHMQIGGIGFAIKSTVPDTLLTTTPAYHSFLVKDMKPGQADIQVLLKVGKIPDFRGMKKLFDSEESWSLYKDGEDFCMVLNPPSLGDQIWLARISNDFKEVSISCNERFADRKNGSVVLSNPASYPLDQILLMYVLAAKGGILVHAAGIEVNGKGLIFPGRSGAGKSTMAMHCIERGGVGLLSDDRVIIRKMDNTYRVFGTPWPGDAGVARNISLPLSEIFFISHGTENRVKEIKSQEAIERLLPVTSIPWYDKEVMPAILDLCEELISRVPAYELYFKPGVEVVDVIETFISNQNIRS